MARDSAPTPATAAEPTPNKAILSVILILTTIMQSLDTTIVNVSLPHMEGTLGATQDQISWVLTSYIIAAAIMMPATGWLDTRLGRRKFLVIAVTGFTVASGLCGLATSVGQIVAFRILQGVFGAPLIPLSQATLLDINSRANIGRAMALWGMGVMASPMLGPTLGGYLTAEYSWRWCFYMNLPLGILAALGALTFMPEFKRGGERKFDWLGFAFVALAIASFQLLLDRGELVGWFGAPEIKIELALAALGLYMFTVHSLTTPAPFIDLTIFRDRNYLLCIFQIMAIGLVFNGSMILTPQLLQTELNYPAVTAGMVMGPRGFGVLSAMWVCGRISNRVDSRVPIFLGLCMLSTSMYLISTWSLMVSIPQIVMTGILQGVGTGMTVAPMTTLAFSTLPGALRTEASGFYSLMRNVGGAIGISIVTSRLTELRQINHGYLGTFLSPYRHAPSMHGVTGTSALELLNLDITHQAGMVAYVNVFRLLSMLSLVFAPLILLTRARRIPANLDTESAAVP